MDDKSMFAMAGVREASSLHDCAISFDYSKVIMTFYGNGMAI
jgi:hypothetical protein